MSGLIDGRDILKIADVIYTPTFARICTYIVTVNYQNVQKNKELDARDAYAQCGRDIVETLDRIVKTYKDIQ